MNIFIMVLVFLFMAGYYFLDSPSQRIVKQELDHAIVQTDLRSIAECAAAAHTAFIRDYSFDDPCMEQYEIVSHMVCLDAKQAVTKCEITPKKKPPFSFIVTATAPLYEENYNRMLEILEEYYSNSGTFGVFMDGIVLSGGKSGKRAVPSGVVKSAELAEGQLVYLTQYEIPDIETEYIAPGAQNITCPVGSIKVYRFSRWQCVESNQKTSCTGDNIWDSDLLTCVPDNSRKPLCAARQTAVMVDDVWECIDPFSEKTCPRGMMARLNYNTLEWECIEDPNAKGTTKKCSPSSNAVYGALGATLRIPASFCNDCEDTITDAETCKITCVPNPSKMSDPKCYPGNTSACSGASRAFYFGFPSLKYAANVSAVAGHAIPLDAVHSQNRKFNCLDCGANGRIDPDKSLAPYIAVCE